MTAQVILLVSLALLGLLASRHSNKNRRKEAIRTGGMILSAAARMRHASVGPGPDGPRGQEETLSRPP